MKQVANIPGFCLGIIGGGQLGRMMCWEARRLGIRTAVLDPAEHAPAQGLADRVIKGELNDPEALSRLADISDVMTYEIEHINSAALSDLQARGAVLRPDASLLATIQDKLAQKLALEQEGLPVPVFREFNPSDPQADSVLDLFGLPCIQKTLRGGYDGRGVSILRDLKAARLEGPSMLEEMVDFKMELSVLLARSTDGQVQCYPVIEMLFDPVTQICNQVCAPARISAQAAEKAMSVSVAAIESLGGVGVFAVELFLMSDDSVLINEIAPRPHNSGHWTIEGAATSQFEQHIRAVCGLPLGSSELIRPSVTVNLLGAKGSGGAPLIRGYDKLMEQELCYLHWYDKAEVRPNRKMGHFTVLHDDLETAMHIAAELESEVTIEGVLQ